MKLIFLSDARGTNSAWAEAQILPTFIRRNIKLAEAPSYGKTIFEYEQNCHGAEDYQKVAQFVHAQYQQPAHTEIPQSTDDESQDSFEPLEASVSQETYEEPEFPQPPVPQVQPLQLDENPEEPLAAPEPASQPNLQEPSEEPEESAEDNPSENVPPFEIKSIPQSEPHTPTEFTPSTEDRDQETRHVEY